MQSIVNGELIDKYCFNLKKFLCYFLCSQVEQSLSLLNFIFGILVTSSSLDNLAIVLKLNSYNSLCYIKFKFRQCFGHKSYFFGNFQHKKVKYINIWTPFRYKSHLLININNVLFLSLLKCTSLSASHNSLTNIRLFFSPLIQEILRI